MEPGTPAEIAQLKPAAINSDASDWTTDDGMGPDGGIRRLAWPNGNSYDGEVDEDLQPHGQGTYTQTTPPQFTYTGQWTHGQAAGQGTCTSPDFGILTGEWRDGQVTGRARVVFVDGAVYDGGWRHNRPNGPGEFINPNGVMFRGQWHNGVFQAEASGYDARGINTCNRHSSAVQLSTNSQAAYSQIQYNGDPGDIDGPIDLALPALAIRAGHQNSHSGAYIYESPEFESPVHPPDHSGRGIRVDSGYLYRTRYVTEAWEECLDEEAAPQLVEHGETVLMKKGKHKAGYEGDEHDGGADEEFPVELENECEQSGKPATATCQTCPDTTYTPRSSAPYTAQYAQTSYYSPAPVSTYPVTYEQVQPDVRPVLYSAPPHNLGARHTHPTHRPLIRVPIPVEAVTSVELTMPKLRVTNRKIDYPVYAPRLIEVPVPSEVLSANALSRCAAIQKALGKLNTPQTATSLDTLTDSIVEHLEAIPNF